MCEDGDLIPALQLGFAFRENHLIGTGNQRDDRSFRQSQIANDAPETLEGHGTISIPQATRHPSLRWTPSSGQGNHES